MFFLTVRLLSTPFFCYHFKVLHEKFLKPYNPQETEDHIYTLWEESGFFKPETRINADAETRMGADNQRASAFSMLLPPPNVTGALHMGHAATATIEDIMVRFHRMRGKKTLWVPGTDHAAIATQSKVEELLYQKEGKTRHDLGRDAFLARVEEFAETSRQGIISQLKKMGASLDWSRLAFTLDEARSRAVRSAFTRMYHDGLIYQGHRIVNWDPKLQTTVSDDEVEWKEEAAPFYYLKYGPFVIGTARPETKFGDKYVVVHPKDARYANYAHGERIPLEWINGRITATVIKDEAIEMEFGTGAMTITPWHDTTDFEIAERHKLEREQIIDERGTLLPIAGEFAGMHIKKARTLIVEKLRGKDLIERTDERYLHRIATNSRGGGVIEPQIKKQWFVAVNKRFRIQESRIKNIEKGQEVTLKELMRTAVANGQIKIIPERFAKIYFHWIDRLRDWCISRQLWYGHRIPVWYRRTDTRTGISNFQFPIFKQAQNPNPQNTGEEVYVGIETPKGDGWEQDPDTLDTWFSSGLWTFSTLGWPAQTKDLERYHPTDVLDTGYDILFFWVARMILMSTYLVGDIPFRTVYLHGLVRDEGGKKMSKSLGNIIDPVEMIEKYGADAMRLSLIVGTAPGNDSRISENKIKGYKHFSNKLWNIARFIMEHTADAPYEEHFTAYGTRDAELWKELHALLEDITDDILECRFYLAAEKLYHYTWHTLADRILEESKELLKNGTPEAQRSRRQFLLYTLEKVLKSLHPFIPFVTEEIWQLWKQPATKEEMLMVQKWPVAEVSNK
ncbi:MAG: valyl-tRNA synthetase [Parcubacteria group bacterium Greene0416_79]|nr:MAG: valyl-tRNA synthetase [Parcubacteria group bacterium Greene0416_79]